MGKLINLTGRIFGYLTVLKLYGYNKNNYALWECECCCENKTILIVRSSDLLNGHTKSCGCYQKEMASQSSKKYNKYDLTGDYGIGYTSKNEEFYFDLEDYEKIKNYCWYIDDEGYPSTNTNTIIKTPKRLHKIIMGTDRIDHENKIRHDNRKQNLRSCSQLENIRNSSIRSNNTSGITGVYYSKIKAKWVAQITIEKGRPKNLGLFSNFKEAVFVRLKAEKEYFGEFAPQKHLFKQYGIE